MCRGEPPGDLERVLALDRSVITYADSTDAAEVIAVARGGEGHRARRTVQSGASVIPDEHPAEQPPARGSQYEQACSLTLGELVQTAPDRRRPDTLQ